MWPLNQFDTVLAAPNKLVQSQVPFDSIAFYFFFIKRQHHQRVVTQTQLTLEKTSRRKRLKTLAGCCCCCWSFCLALLWVTQVETGRSPYPLSFCFCLSQPNNPDILPLRLAALQRGWFRQELVGTDIPCWPNYYSLLCCHIRWASKDNRLESASVIRWWWRRTPAGAVKLTIKERVMNRMISKWLPSVCISLCV